jgi:precorrin-2/cobalt-factor-2 C20-methyltransferase
MMKAPKLYGIGVGPGSPDLLTLKAVQTLGKIDVVFCPSSATADHSLALDIVRPYLRPDTEIVNLTFAMSRDEATTRETWKNNAAQIHHHLMQNKHGAFLTLGDPLIYSTFSYIMKELKALAVSLEFEVIPGITSFQAAAARLAEPLVEGEETLVVTSAARLLETEEILSLTGGMSLVVMKPFRKIKETVDLLARRAGGFCSTAVSHCSLPKEKIYRDIGELKDQKANYWTLILSKKNERPTSDRI